MKLSRPFLHCARLTVAVLFWPAAGVVIWGSLTPYPLTQVPMSGDKAVHFIAYFFLAAMAASAFQTRRRALLSALGLIALGATLELLQSFVGRETSFVDQLANTFGVLLGGTLAHGIVKLLRRLIPNSHTP